MKEWISVEKELPQEGAQYLCVEKVLWKPYYKICRYTKDLYKLDKYDFYDKKNIGGFYMYDSEYGYILESDIIAWMPIPEYTGK